MVTDQEESKTPTHTIDKFLQFNKRQQLCQANRSQFEQDYSYTLDSNLINNSWEYEVSSYLFDIKVSEYIESKDSSVQGRIAAHKQWWFDNLQLSSFVSGVLFKDYCIPFVATPPSCCIKNNRSALSHGQFVANAIHELLLNRCIVEVPYKPYCCNPLSVVEGRKLRLVLDLSRSVNLFVKPFKFKYEGLPTLASMLEENQWFFTFDIESGYHHIDINCNDREYLGFSWCFSGIPRYFMFKVLPFGLSSACYLFTRMFRPLVLRWRSLGILAVMYIDDGIFTCRSREEAVRASELVRRDLKESGWKYSVAKSRWEPHQIGVWLGIMINTIQMLFVIPEKKVVKLKSTLAGLLTEFPNLRVRNVASICGFVISFSSALGTIARLFTRQMYAFVESRMSWNDTMSANGGVLQELQFWSENIDAFNGYPIHRGMSFHATVSCDASDTGYGASLIMGNEQNFCSGMWDVNDICQSSTFRELKAIFLALVSFVNLIKNCKVKIFTDNQNAVRIVHCGSRLAHLQEVSLQIFNFCLCNRISFQVQWIPRAENEVADYLSRIVDPDDYMLNPVLFRLIVVHWDVVFDIDRMAGRSNSQLARFNSKFWCPGTEAVDCFTQDWGGKLL